MRHGSKISFEDAYSVIEPCIDAEGKHHFHFDPAFPVAVRFLKFGKRHEIRMNRHDYFELLYVHAGEVVYQVQERSLHLHSGDLFVMGSTLPHRMCEFPKGALRTAALYFHPDLLRKTESAAEDTAYLMPFLVQDSHFPHVVPASTGIPAQVFDLIKRTSGELPATTSRARLTVRTFLKMMLVLLVNHYEAFRGDEETFGRKQRELERVKPLLEYLEQHYAEPLTVEDAAAILHMSKSTFMRFFKSVMGQPFLAYLNHLRVAKAESLLETTGLSIAEVAHAAGFCDQSYFGLVFRSLMRVTPREYRQALERQKLTELGAAATSWPT